MIGRFGRSELRPPIILFGNVRSGTSVVQNVISAHPDVVAWYEPRNLWQYADPQRGHDEFDAWDATADVQRYIRRKFLQYQERNDGRIVFEKTPVNILRIPYVREIFPEARVLYIVRSPLSYISSVELKWQRTVTVRGLGWRLRSTPPSQIHRYVGKYARQHYDKRVLRRKYLSVWGPRYRGIAEDAASLDMMTVIARQWAHCSAKAEADLVAFPEGSVLRLRYEDFVLDPVWYSELICRHVGIDFTDEVVAAARQIVKTDRLTKWERFDPDLLAAILPELADEMERHGYEIPARLTSPILADGTPNGGEVDERPLKNRSTA